MCTIQLNEGNSVTGSLPDGQNFNLIVDSGATMTVISSMYLESKEYLKNLPKQKCEPYRIRIADGSIVESVETIRFPVRIQGYDFSLCAQVMPTCGLVSCLLGTADLRRLRAQLDFATHTLKFFIPDRVPFKAVANDILKPHSARVITLQGKLPKNAQNGQIVINSSYFARRLTSECYLTNVRRGHCQVQVYNPTDKVLKINRGSIMGFLDLNASHSTLYHLNVEGKCNKDIVNDEAYVNDRVYHMNKEALIRHNIDTYPFLEPNDPKLSLTDAEIIDSEVDLDSDSALGQKGRLHLRQMLLHHKSVFSLRGEVGDCKYEVKLDLTNTDPFFIRPYTVSEAEKRLIDIELTKLVKMGVLKLGSASSCSPIMLVKKKGGARRVVADLRFLNTRIRKRNWPFPLVKDTVQRLGASGCKVMSTIDLKDAFHCLRLHKDSQRHVGVTSYYGGSTYYYQRLPQGASLSPCEFQCYIQSVLDEIPGSNEFVIAHMDDLIVFSPSDKEHFHHLDILLGTLRSHGLKLSPKKAQFFKSVLEYMGHIILIKDGRPHITPMRAKCEGIRRLHAPQNPRQVKSFIGAVSYLSMYLPRLQELLAPMHRLTSTKRDFLWSEECDRNFKEIREMLVDPPILAMPSAIGKIRLYSDTSRYATGASICQEIDGKERLLAYHSKTLPDAAQRYSVTELEFYGLYQNVLAFKNILKGVHFDAFVDHSALAFMMKSKAEPPTNRIQKLIELLSDYSFDLYYKKGSEMVICDMLSRMCIPNSDDPLGDAIPVACNLDEDFVHILSFVSEGEPTRRVTRSYAKEHGISVPSATSKTMDFSQPGASKPTSITGPVSVPADVPFTPMDTSSLDCPPYSVPSRPQASLEVPGTSSNPAGGQDFGCRDPPAPRTLIQNQGRSSNPIPISGMIPRREVSSDTGAEFEELMKPTDEVITRPNLPLFPTNKKNHIVSSHIPKQQDIDKCLKEIQKKCLHDFNVPLKTAELRREYSSSPYFGQVYSYLTKGLLPAGSKIARSVLTRAEEFILVNDLMFRFKRKNPDDDFELTLAVPESLAEYIVSQYHDGLFACHQGINRTFQTISRIFFIPNLFNRLVGYIKSCEVCQQRKIPQERDNGHEYHPRIFTGYSPFSEIHMDIKYVFPAYDNSQYLLVVTCVQTRFIIAIPLKTMTCTNVAEALLQRVVFQFGIPKRLVSDQGKSFDNKLLEYLMKCLKIEGTLVSPENHGSLVVERSIQSIAKLLLSQLEGHGRDWPLYIQATCFAYNTFSHSTLGGFSPFEMVYGRLPPDPANIEIKPSDEVPTTYEGYVGRLRARLRSIGATVVKLHNDNQQKQVLQHNQSLRKKITYRVGQLVYFLMPTNSNLNTNTRKFTVNYIGPVRIKEVLDTTHVILEDLEGRLITGIHHIKRIKPATLRGKEKLYTDFGELEKDSIGFVGLMDQVDSDMPVEGADLHLTKSRWKLGRQQVLFASPDNSWNMWYNLDEDSTLGSSVSRVHLSRVVGSRRKYLPL